MPTDRTEVTGQDGGPIQLEVSTALTKIYGELIELSGDSHAGPPVDDRQILLLPRGDCTDAGNFPEVRSQKSEVRDNGNPPTP